MVLFTPSLVICYHYICCIENYVTGDDFVDLDEMDFKQLFPRFGLRKIVRGVHGAN